MSGIPALLKIFCVPILAAALNQIVLLLVSGMRSSIDMHLLLSEYGDAARTAFVIQAAIALLLTSVLGLPFFRFCARHNKSGYASWLTGWVLVHFPIACLYLLNNDRDHLHWISPASLAFSVGAVASLWWWWFYAERPTPV